MGVPGDPPPGLAATELFAVDAYRRAFDSTVTESKGRDDKRVRIDVVG